MLICPQCHYENPDSNKFCQSCGTSLTSQVCYQCGTQVAFSSPSCSNCGAVTGIALMATISSVSDSERSAETKETSVVESNSVDLASEAISTVEKLDKSLPTTLIASLPESNSQYLDRHRRYLKDKSSSTKSNQFRVFDCQPLQKTHLEQLEAQHRELFAELERIDNNSYLSMTQYWNLIGVPTQALPYLILEKFAPTIPEIYDAWQEDDRGIVLLSDRSDWQLLADFWQSEAALLPILWSLDEIAKLWTPLKQINCCSSLIKKENLKIDEDQTFCLERLYLDRTEPTLLDLGQTWRSLLASIEDSELTPLKQLVEQMASGNIKTIEEFRAQLHQLVPEEYLSSFLVEKNEAEINSDRSAFEEYPADEETTTENTDFFAEEEMFYINDSEEEPTIMLSLELLSLSDAGGTDIGSQRDHNEDFFGIKTSISRQENPAEKKISARGLYIVCDGMGGHAAGEVASAMAVETLQNYFQTHWQEELPDEETIKKGIWLTNQTLYQTNLDNSRSGAGRMGTTLVMALVQDNYMAIASVGDSRIYRVTRKHGLEQLTTDHEVGQREINRGVEPEIAYGRPDAYQLTQALGPRNNEFVRPDIQYLEVQEDSLIILCSDGLTDNDLLEQHWETYIAPANAS